MSPSATNFDVRFESKKVAVDFRTSVTGFGGKPNRAKGRGVNRKMGTREERDGEV